METSKGNKAGEGGSANKICNTKRNREKDRQRKP
jgi:hypothetical protein